MAKKSIDKWQYVDFQTPIELARKIVKLLRRNHNIAPDVIIEPTCGKGAFVLASYEEFKNSNIIGFEINMLAQGMETEMIASLTGLSPETIEKLSVRVKGSK